MVDQQLIDLVETDFLKVIVKVLNDGTLTLEQAQAVTREFLALAPFTDKDDLDKKVQAFIEKYSDFKPVHLAFLQYDEKKKTDELLAQMRQLVKENKIEEALLLAKK